MTQHGNKIPGLTTARVREQLADETDPKAIKRLTAAREYLDGLSPEEIEDKYGWHHQTIYNWLNRFEERGFAIENLEPGKNELRGRLEHFRDVLIVDATFISLYQDATDVYTAAGDGQAGLKLHLTESLSSDLPTRLRTTDGKTHERSQLPTPQQDLWRRFWRDVIAPVRAS